MKSNTKRGKVMVLSNDPGHENGLREANKTRTASLKVVKIEKF